jgi:hypothetical protein
LNEWFHSIYCEIQSTGTSGIIVACSKYLRSKTVTNGNVKEEITEEIKYSVKFYQLLRDIWKWEMPKKWKICLFKSHYIHILWAGIAQSV